MLVKLEDQVFVVFVRKYEVVWEEVFIEIVDHIPEQVLLRLRLAKFLQFDIKLISHEELLELVEDLLC